MYKFILIAHCLLACMVQAYSQKDDNNYINQSPKFYWGVSLTPAIFAKAAISGDKNKYSFRSSPQLGIEFIFNGYYNFERLCTLGFGIGGGAFDRNFDYSVTREMFDLPTGADFFTSQSASRKLDIKYFRLPVELEKRWLHNSQRAWNLATGFSVLYTLPYSRQSGELIRLSNGQLDQYLTIDLNNNDNNGKPWFNFHISGGHEWALRSNNILRINLKANYSPTNFVTGTYRFNVGNEPESNGRYSVSGSYIGACVSYIFYKNKSSLKNYTAQEVN